MKSVTLAAACVLAVLLGVMVAPSTQSQLSVAKAKDRLRRVFLDMEARRKGKSMSGEMEDGPPPIFRQPKKWFQGCADGSITSDVFCGVIQAVGDVVKEMDPCVVAAAKDDPEEEEITACAEKIQMDLSMALGAQEKEFHFMMMNIGRQVLALAKATGVLEKPEGMSVDMPDVF